MKLKELIEVNFQNVDVYEPSGNSGGTTVDPDEWKRAQERDKDGRSKKMRDRFKMIKKLRSPRKETADIKYDNHYDAHSTVNGPFNY